VSAHDRLVAKTPHFPGSIGLTLMGLGVVFFFAMAGIKLKTDRANP
jgi:hypothetical protein